ncbi:PREDICTED: hepatocyte nuclear factor 6 [Bison bison bison]|uniref:One cut domain family member n=1 Tax=Bison bison bison TaxID=43346 RepID=A0A6P3H7F0_BISBB|nr:PREDICTED: hepatocyte nuclear factor 6 [Bison bison bison]
MRAQQVRPGAGRRAHPSQGAKGDASFPARVSNPRSRSPLDPRRRPPLPHHPALLVRRGGPPPSFVRGRHRPRARGRGGGADWRACALRPASGRVGRGGGGGGTAATESATVTEPWLELASGTDRQQPRKARGLRQGSRGPHNSKKERGERGHLPPAHPRSMGMASLLDGGGGSGDYHHHHRAPEHSLAGPLHPTMTMACETPPGMSMPTTYTTLTPLQPLPPISTVSDKFPHHHHHHHHPHHHQRLAGNVSGSFTLMRDERGLASMNNLYTPYHKDVAGMGQSLSPLSGSGLGGIHNSQQGLPHYAHPGAAMPTDKMLTPNGFEAHHPAMLGRHGEQHLTPTSAGMVPINGLPPHHPHAHLNAQGHGQLLGTAREPNPSVTGAQVSNGSNSGQMEEINTKEVAQRITTELKRYSIPQAIFAQRVLCRSQGTLSDLLRNPKPWSKLKSGRETFRRMWKWLQEPEFQRMSALRLAACKRKEQEHGKDRGNTPKKPRLVFTDVQRRTLHAIFKENKRPSKELQITISQQLGLELSTVSNFFMNARRRSLDKWQDEGGSNSGNSSSSSSTCTKA